MEGKKIVKVVELGEGYQIIKFDDNTFAFIKVIEPELLEDELLELFEEPEKSDKGSKEKEDKGDKEDKEEKKEKEQEGDDYTWADLEAMNYRELKKFVEDNKLDTDPEDFEKDEVDDFREEIADEINVKVPKKPLKKSAEEDKEDKEEKKEKTDDKYTWADLKEMDFEELSSVCDEEDLAVDPKDYDEEDEDKMRREMAEEMGISAPPKKKPVE